MVTFAVLLSLALAPSVPLAHLFLIRLSGKADRAIAFMFLSFGIYAMAWSYFFFKHAGFSDGKALIAGVAAISFWMLSYMEAFSMLCRGFSLTIMVDVFEKGGMSERDVVDAYGDGKGAGWLLDKRLETMRNLQMVEKNAKGISLRPRGRLAGFVALLFKRTLRMGLGG